jgi:uncharacterized protein YutE (UPF0331/DUF86 family)
MTALDREVLAERISAVERHLTRVEAKLPPTPDRFTASTDASDAVLLHLWLAVQIVVDLAVSLCVRLALGAPATYGDAFERLARAGHLEQGLAERLAKAAGFRNLVAHAYESVDMQRVYDAAVRGPADLRAFLVIARNLAADIEQGRADKP